jgi:class 3 adenylate cyclase/predicted ATPase
MHCSKCGFDNPEGMKFCGQCTAPLALVCPNCGFENPPGFKFCGQCTTPLAPGLTAPRASKTSVAVRETDGSEALDGERKMVTALFADIKGSMELMEDLDPEEARWVVDPALRLMMDAVHRYGGYIVQSTGDGIFALFGAPAAHEDHPQRAVYAALRLQEQLSRYSDHLRSQGRLPLQARVGLNTGEVVVRSLATGEAHTEYAPIGHSTSLAARMQVLAPVGSVAAADATRKLCEGYFTFKSLGPTVVKGVSEAVNVYEVTGLGPLRTRLQRSAAQGLTRFVGRERELAAMKEALDLVRAGHGQIVAAIGEPGVGKSRLFYEFRAVTQSGCLVLDAFSVSHGKASAYLPVIELLKDYFQIVADDDERRRREKVAGKIMILDRMLEDALPYLYALLEIEEELDPLGQLDVQLKRRRTLETIKRILLRESLNQPLIVVFEDLHWIDGETQALLNLLADGIANARVLMLVNYRPEYRHEWGSKTYYTQLRLDPLGVESAAQMLSALLGESGELVPLKRLIIDKTEGNPFFIEEMVQALFEQRVLARNGVVRIAKPLTAARIPVTVQDLLASRIDRLGANEKALLQTLAVLGKEFSLSLIEQVGARSGVELERMLSALQLAEFIYEQPAFPEVEYTFKHALTQEVAYNSMLSERRKQLHERTAQAIGKLFDSELETHLSDLAHHYSRSGNAAKAVEYLQRAGEQAIERSANAEAITQFSAALDLLKTLPEGTERAQRETGLQLLLGGALGVATGPGELEVKRAFSRAQELSFQIHDDALLFHALAGIWYHHQVAGEVEPSLEVGKQLLHLSQTIEEPARLKFAHLAMAQSLLYLGDVIPSVEHIRQSEAIADAERRATSYHLGEAPPRWLAISANAFWQSGYPDQAMGRCRDALAQAEELSHGYVSAVTRMFCGYFCADCRHIQAVLRHAEAGAAISSEYGFWLVSPNLLMLRGWALIHLGAVEEGFDQISRGVGMLPSLGVGYYLSRRFIAEAYLLTKRTEEGLRLVNESLQDLEKGKRRVDHAELYRLKGELLLLQNARPRADAEVCFRTAIELARGQQARSWELRSTVGLARLLAAQDRRAEARTMLTDIYNWFTEGFDTADLKEAKALLDELQA